MHLLLKMNNIKKGVYLKACYPDDFSNNFTCQYQKLLRANYRFLILSGSVMLHILQQKQCWAIKAFILHYYSNCLDENTQ